MMASACVNIAGTSPEIILDCPPACPSYGWLSPRISFSGDSADDGQTIATDKPKPEAGPVAAERKEKPDPDASAKDLSDFEFRLEDPVAMLPADELFSGGKLVPLQLAAARLVADEIRPPEPPEPRGPEDLRPVAAAPSPRAPRCSSRWRELLGLKRQQQQQGPKMGQEKAAAATASKNRNTRSLKLFLRRDPKSSSIDPSLSLPLLRDSDSETVSLSSRRSLSSSSSSSSGQDHEDLPRLSLETDKPSQIPTSHTRNPHPPRVRVSRPRSATPDRLPASRASRSPVRRAPEEAAVPRGASVDSPRMNASGRVVFERSSSSPGSFTGGPRVRHRGMERSYSAGVRVAPVLNVPVFGLGQLFRKERDGASAARNAGGGGSGSGSIRIKIERDRV